MSAYDVVGRARFAVGDNVCRPLDRTVPDSPLEHGTVAMVYRAPGAGWKELYSVNWESGRTDEGLLPSGLMLDVEWLWASRRARAMHAFVPGAGTGDAALCGAIAQPGGRPSQFENEPRCARCAALSQGKP